MGSLAKFVSFTLCATSRSYPGRKGSSFKHLLRLFQRESALAGQVRMDLEPGRTRVNEHAETGKPQAEFKLHGCRERNEPYLAPIHRAVCPCNRHGFTHGWNGPADRGFFAILMVGHKLSAIGSPLRAFLSAR
jgi:hypothetical protein